MRKYIAHFFFKNNEETNEETGLFSSFAHRRLEWVAHNTQVLEFFMEGEPDFTVLLKNDQKLNNKKKKMFSTESFFFCEY